MDSQTFGHTVIVKATPVHMINLTAIYSWHKAKSVDFTMTANDLDDVLILVGGGVQKVHVPLTQSNRL